MDSEQTITISHVHKTFTHSFGIHAITLNQYRNMIIYSGMEAVLPLEVEIHPPQMERNLQKPSDPPAVTFVFGKPCTTKLQRRNPKAKKEGSLPPATGVR